ncbi:hypothetical protein [Sorangium sp. So ce117]|uniref:hypothetical protein n=1 Tax=Sorangium sp. So ce117 TaxID=3133277 RepID=UPI003F62C452
MGGASDPARPARPAKPLLQGECSEERIPDGVRVVRSLSELHAIMQGTFRHVR